MRKRNHIIPLHLNKKELAHLETQVKQSGLPREEFLRTLPGTFAYAQSPDDLLSLFK